jgi:hypothetical protein
VLVAVAAFMVAFLVGKLGANPPSAVRRAAVFLARHPLSFASSCTAVLLGGILALHERVLIVRPCLGYLDEFSSINVENLAGSDGITKVGDLLRDAESGSSACLAAYIPREAARLANTRDALAQRQAALEEKAKQDREAAEGAARAAALQAKVDAWPSTRVEIEAKINEAATEVKTGEFIGADTALDAAQKMLDDLRGTQVEATESWSTLAKQAQSDRTKIRRQVGRIRKQREAEEKQREAEEEKRNEAFAQEQAVREQRLAAAARSDLRKECSVSHETAAGKTNCEGWFVVCGSEANDGIPYYLSSQGCAVMGSGLAMPFLFGVDVPGHLETERTMSTWCCSKSP